VGVLALLVVAVTAESDPTFSVGKVCSIQGTGSVNFKYNGDKYEGTVAMKRVHNTARYDMSVHKEGSSETVTATALFRPDIGTGEEYFKIYEDNGSGGDLENRLESFKYDPDFKPVEGKEYYCFSIKVSFVKHPMGAMLFSKDKKMDLIGEWLDFADGITILYDTVEYYEHENVDDTFSLDYPRYPSAKTQATEAITSTCPESASMFAPSLFLVLLAALVLALF